MKKPPFLRWPLSKASPSLLRNPWIPYLRKYGAHYAAVVTCIALALPLTLALILFVTYAFRQLQSPVQSLTWLELVGEHASRWLRPHVRGTSFEAGLPAEFQTTWFVPILAGLALVVAGLKFAQEWMLEDLGEKIARDVRTIVGDSWTDLPFSQADAVEGAVLANVMGEDAREVRQAFTRLWGSVPADALACVVFASFLAILDTQLFALLIAILAPAGIVIRVTGKTLKKLARQGLRSQAELLEALLEKMRGWQTIQILGGVSREVASFNITNDRLFTLWRRQARAKALASPLVEWLGIVAAAFVIVLALRRIAEGALTSGILTAFLVTIAQLANAGQSLSSQLNSTRRGTEALRRAHGLLIDWLGVEAATDRVRSNGRRFFGALQSRTGEKRLKAVSLKNLALAHPTEGRLLAENIAVELRLGDLLAVHGPSGAGKSTLVRILLGLQAPAHGVVCLNADTATGDEAKYTAFAHDIAFLPQEPFVLDGSLFENVIYPERGSPDDSAVLARVEGALEAANLRNKAVLASVVGFSGGERQRLMFARAFFRDATFWVIDEGTSALDSLNESEIMGRLQSSGRPRIVVAVAHRESVRKLATCELKLGTQSTSS
ncbi:MAG: ABC transporter ATP-binding protein [Silvanigrellales bacterium]|jgi:ABC-type multidrug transport system fused ATPase/permease subunit|nr:ABC transporter ATP-binding protein [Silvanigrellales bacterium]